MLLNNDYITEQRAEYKDRNKGFKKNDNRREERDVRKKDVKK
jgi:hypothetical protein